MPFITRNTISATFLDRVKMTPNAIGFVFKPTHPDFGTVNQWREVTYAEFYKECRLLAYGIMALGVKPTDKVAVVSNTRFEWWLSDIAILGAGAVTVPIYASSTLDEVIYILNHSEARLVILEDAKQLDKILEARKKNPDALPNLLKIVCIDPAAVAGAGQAGTLSDDVLTLNALKELGRRDEPKNPTRFDDNLTSAKPSDLITIGYTSGTTGQPKGVMLTHDNMMSVLEDCVLAISGHVEPEKETTLAFLPTSHVLGKVESMATYTFGWKAYFAESIDSIVTNLADAKPTLMFAVPRIFEKVYGRIKGQIEAGPPAKKAMFDWAMKVGQRYFQSVWNKKTPALADTIQYEIAKRVVFKKVRERLGGRLKFAICGGAPLPREIGEFFQVANILVLEGYGLTETCAPVAVNTPDDPRFGVVGRPLPEVTIKIAEDGEILVRSRKVFKGYYKQEEETAKTIVNGWLHTGDIGFIDADGFLKITDRKKDIIVTSAGKNVAPQKIENIAKTYSLITQFVVHGDKRNYLTALLTLDREQVIRFATERNILFSEYAELIKHPQVINKVQEILNIINSQLASFETVKRFTILPSEFTVESGELTPSLKVKRAVIGKRYAEVLDRMYSGS